MKADGPRLTRQVALMAPVRTPDRAGGYHETWETLGQLWAEITPRSGAAAAVAHLPMARTGFKITVRAAPLGSPQRPVPGQEMHEAGRRWIIDAVTERDAQGRFLLCWAHEDEVAT